MSLGLISRRKALTAFGAALAAGALPAAAPAGVRSHTAGDNGLKLTEAQLKAGATFLAAMPR